MLKLLSGSVNFFEKILDKCRLLVYNVVVDFKALKL